MSIASRIEEMNVHVTDAYDAIELSGRVIDYDKNIDNLDIGIKNSYLDIMNNPDTIDVIWDNWEKVTGTGTTLTLNQTAHAPMKIDYAGNTYQESLEGKNLFDKSNIAYDMLNIYEQQAAGETRITSSNETYCVYVPITANGDKFTISGLTRSYNVAAMKAVPTAGGGSDVYYWTYTGSQTGAYTTLSLPSTCTYIALFFTLGDSTLADIVDHLQIEKSASATSYEPYTGGNPAPNPDFPMTVHTVSGDNTIKVEGKNLFSSIWEQGGITSTTGENISNNSLIRTKDYISVKPNTNYSIMRSIPNQYIAVRGYDKNKNFIGSGSNAITLISGQSGSTSTNPMVNGASFCVISTNDNVCYLRFQDASNDLSTNYMMVEGNYTSSTMPTYEPYTGATYPINLGEYELCKIGDYKDRFFKTSGKNLANVSITGQVPSITTGELASSTSGGTTDFTKIDNTKNYLLTFTFSTTNQAYVFYYDTNKTFLGYAGANIGSTTGYQLSDYSNWNNAKYIRVRIDNLSNASQIMLNEGTTALPYEPYGEVFYLKKEIGKVVLNGSEDWDGNVNGFYHQENTLKRVQNYTDYIMCTNLQIATQNSGMGYGKITGYYSSTGNYPGKNWFYVRIENITSSSDLQTWLSTHNTTVYYVLDTPTYTKITDSTLLSQLEEVKKSYESQTNISQTNDDLPFELSVVALQGE